MRVVDNSHRRNHMPDLHTDQLQSFKARKGTANLSSQDIATALGIGVEVVTGWEDGSIRCTAGQAAAYERAIAALGG